MPAEPDRIDAYDYDLPKGLIADRPLAARDASRLLVLHRDKGRWEHRTFRDLPDYLAPGDVAVFNTTRVLPAKIRGVRAATGGKWEGLFLSSEPGGRWRLTGKTKGKIRPGETVLVRSAGGAELPLRFAEKIGAEWLVEGDDRPLTLADLDAVGEMPLPPYIDRDAPDPADSERYQTVFSREPGAIAAPTAGLHFTEETLAALADRGVRRADVILHVGVGTFRPVTAERLDDHVMHSEQARIDAAAVETITAGGTVLAVGTTSVRTLETAAAGGTLRPFEGPTDLFIRPPYEFRVVERLLTNFHLPKSTLLVLVSAMAGRELVLDAYADAVREGYRFFSYGDAMLIL